MSGLLSPDHAAACSRPYPACIRARARCPAPDVSSVGPVGNTLDRGVGYTPYAEHFLFQSGMEVVLANGEVLRTGMGGVKGSNTWQVFKWGYGPYLDGLFTQSNYGIVTKMGLWLMPEPEVFKPFAIKYRNDEDIMNLVELFRPLSISGIIPNGVVLVGTLYEASATVGRSDYTTDKGPTPKAIIQRIRDEHKIGAWTAYGALYGTRRSTSTGRSSPIWLNDPARARSSPRNRPEMTQCR